MAKKRHKSSKKKTQTKAKHSLLFWLLLLINIMVAAPLLFAFAAAFLPPSFSGLLVLCSIGFKYLVIANIAFVIIWIPLSYKHCLLSLSLLLLNINNIDKHIQLHAHDVPDNCPHPVKIMSYNANLFGLYKDDDMDKRRQEKDKILDFIVHVQPDILCFQEYFWDKNEQLNFHTTDFLLKELQLPETNEHYYQYFTHSNKKQYYYGLSIFSRYRIVNAEPIITDSSSNAAVFVDIKHRSDTFRIYNLHLSSLHLNATDYAVSEQIVTTNFSDPKMDKNIKKLYHKLAETAVKRQQQVDKIRANMDSCRYPIIVCGDFNEPPTGYAYNQIAHKLHDTFRRSGSGLGNTYHGKKMPPYRIDYILHDKNYHSYGHTVCDSLAVSDHYPIYATISLLKKQ